MPANVLSRLAACLACLLLITACGNRAGPESADESLYQDEIGEAVFRKLLADIPEIEDGAPKIYSLVLYGNLIPCEMDFVERFQDTGKKFADARYLRIRSDGHPVDPESQLSPITVQIKLIRPAGQNAYIAETGWSYKGRYEFRDYRVSAAPGRPPEVTLESVSDAGQWKPGDPRPAEQREKARTSS